MTFHNFKFEIASAKEIEECRRTTSEALMVASPQTTYQKRIPKDLLDYLRFISETPEMSSTQRDKAYEIPGAKGTRLRKKLKDLDLIQEFEVNPGGHGRKFKGFRLTESGEGALKTK